MQNTAPDNQIWPNSFFESGNPHSIPLLALAVVHRHDLHCIGPQTAGGNRLGRQFLLLEREKEITQTGASARTKPICRIKERHDGIEFMVGVRTVIKCGISQLLRPSMWVIFPARPRQPQ